MRLEREHAPLAKNRLASLTEEKDLEKKKASLHCMCVTWRFVSVAGINEGFENMLERYTDFRRLYPEDDIKQRMGRLGIWVDNTRRNRRNGKLHDDRIKEVLVSSLP